MILSFFGPTCCLISRAMAPWKFCPRFFFFFFAALHYPSLSRQSPLASARPIGNRTSAHELALFGKPIRATSFYISSDRTLGHNRCKFLTSSIQCLVAPKNKRLRQLFQTQPRPSRPRPPRAVCPETCASVVLPVSAHLATPPSFRAARIPCFYISFNYGTWGINV